METVLIVIHLMVVLALVGVVLLQRSEGGGLGIDEGIMIATFVLLIGAIVLVYFAGESYSIPKAG